ncbi:MAG TPA: carboxypeptidase-like regulatory domain-containing protein [Bacteroidia bacterium]|nr:carboxypeptidase-like regulatory domain-containing protein [Bacteroidia bacterium]
MKKIKLIIKISALVLPLLMSCTKPFNCSGTVYSSHGVPMPNVRVYLNIFTTSSDYPTLTNQCYTDANGFYVFSDKVRKKAYLTITCRCDSGYALNTPGNWAKGGPKSADLHLKP